MTEIEKLKNEVRQIKERNRRVEIDKAWETSIARRVLLAGLTYVTITIFFIAAEISNPFVNAIVPTIGFLLSTLTLNIFKKVWIKSMLQSKDLKATNNER
jgi:hypothetical protein